MAHVAKIKSSGVSPMLGHYEREAEAKGYERENIDRERTHLNYAVGFGGNVHALSRAIKERVSEAVRGHETASGKAIRKDANVVMDWVITRPRDCPEELTEAFFASAAAFVQERYGAENVLGGFVHMDETTPHVHIPVIPVRDGKLQASKVIGRRDLKTFHGDLSERIERDLGVHVSIELDEAQKGAKQLSHLSQDDYRAAQAELARMRGEEAAAQERLERLRGEEERLAREVEELEPAAESFTESARYLAQHRGDGEREARLAGEVGQLRERVGNLDRGVRELRGSHRTLRERFEELGGRLASVMRRLGEVPDYLSDLALELAQSLGIGTFDPVSRMLENAERAAEKYNQSHRGWDDPTPRRGWGRSR